MLFRTEGVRLRTEGVSKARPLSRTLSRSLRKTASQTREIEQGVLRPQAALRRLFVRKLFVSGNPAVFYVRRSAVVLQPLQNTPLLSSSFVGVLLSLCLQRARFLATKSPFSALFIVLRTRHCSRVVQSARRSHVFYVSRFRVSSLRGLSVGIRSRSHPSFPRFRGFLDCPRVPISRRARQTGAIELMACTDWIQAAWLSRMDRAPAIWEITSANSGRYGGVSNEMSVPSLRV